MTSLEVARPNLPQFEELSNEELRALLVKKVSLSAVSLMEAAEIWKELQRRGVEMSAFRSGLGMYFPRIARGELAAEAVVAFAGQRVLLQHMIGMPLDEQRRYAAGEPITVADRDDDGQIMGAQRRLSEMSAREVTLAIADGRVRPLKVQAESLARKVTRAAPRRAKSGSTARIRADVSAGTLAIGRTRLEPLDLASALRALGFDLVRRKDG